MYQWLASCPSVAGIASCITRKCSQLHGHNARVVLTSGRQLDRLEMVADFVTIQDRVGAWIDTALDHR
jgi:6-pyruvoyl-tetrahydropterin synthase